MGFLFKLLMKMLKYDPGVQLSADQVEEMIEDMEQDDDFQEKLQKEIQGRSESDEGRYGWKPARYLGWVYVGFIGRYYPGVYRYTQPVFRRNSNPILDTLRRINKSATEDDLGRALDSIPEDDGPADEPPAPAQKMRGMSGEEIQGAVDNYEPGDDPDDGGGPNFTPTPTND